MKKKFLVCYQCGAISENKKGLCDAYSVSASLSHGLFGGITHYYHVTVYDIVKKKDRTEELLDEAREWILSIGGNEEDVEQISEEIIANKYTCLSEVKAHIENYYYGYGQTF